VEITNAVMAGASVARRLKARTAARAGFMGLASRFDILSLLPLLPIGDSIIMLEARDYRALRC
jgi:hypothetical protein